MHNTFWLGSPCAWARQKDIRPLIILADNWPHSVYSRKSPFSSKHFERINSPFPVDLILSLEYLSQEPCITNTIYYRPGISMFRSHFENASESIQINESKRTFYISDLLLSSLVFEAGWVDHPVQLILSLLLLNDRKILPCFTLW